MWFLAARHSQLTHLTRYHHALYFKKIAQAGHKRNYSNEIYNRENVNQVLGLKNFGASVTFSQDERKQTFMAASLSSRNYFQRGVKGLCLVSSFKMCLYILWLLLSICFIKTLYFANQSNNILEKSDNSNYSLDKRANDKHLVNFCL